MLREIQRKCKSLSGSQRFKGFKALQTQSVQFYLFQVNPHLLHNVLECINWLAEFGRKEEIRSVTLALSRLMQNGQPYTPDCWSEEAPYSQHSALDRMTANGVRSS